MMFTYSHRSSDLINQTIISSDTNCLVPFARLRGNLACFKSLLTQYVCILEYDRIIELLINVRLSFGELFLTLKRINY